MTNVSRNRTEEMRARKMLESQKVRRHYEAVVGYLLSERKSGATVVRIEEMLALLGARG